MEELNKFRDHIEKEILAQNIGFDNFEQYSKVIKIMDDYLDKLGEVSKEE